MIGWLIIVGYWAAVLGVAASFARRGWLDLAQARVLTEEVSPSRLDQFVGRACTLRGEPFKDAGIGLTAAHARTLWFCERYLEKSGSGEDVSYRVVREDVAPWDFTLDVGGVPVRVKNAPTEVHGTTTHASGGEGPWHSETEVLPLVSRLTVCGALVRHAGDLWLVRDDRVGLLFAPEPPHERARREELKGWLNLLLAPAGILAFASWIAYQLRPLFL